jgi:hypothetical protein
MAASEYINHPVSMTPPGVILGLKFLGLTLNEWVAVGSAVLIALQFFVLIRDKFYRPWKEQRDRRNP